MNVGDRVKHMVTGFEGIAIGITTYLAGCDQVGVQPEKLHDGKTISVHWFDITMLTVVKENVVIPSDKITKKPGGPQSTPSGKSG